MISMKVTMDGKEVDFEEITDHIVREAVRAAYNDFKAKLSQHLSAEEFSRLAIDLKKKPSGSYAIGITCPDDLAEKVTPFLKNYAS